jgi:hypothetical protein
VKKALAAFVVALGVALLAGLFVTAGSKEPPTDTYFEGKHLKITVKELEPGAAAAIIARNAPLHSIYVSEGCEPDGQLFVKVMDAINGDGTSSLWRGVQIEFSPGYPCRQFRSDAEIAAAVNAGEISLNPTGYIYRCQVVGSDR